MADALTSMKPAPFQYHAPTTVADVVAALDELGDEAKILAGGQSLVPMLNLRLARFEHLVDIGRVAELRGVERRNGHVSIGAATRDVIVERDATVAARRAAAGQGDAVHRPLPDPQSRHDRRLAGPCRPGRRVPGGGGGARRHVPRRVGARHAPDRGGEFFDGVWSTTMEADELLTSIDFPVWTGRCGFGVAEFARRHGDFAIAGAVAGVELDGDTVGARRARPSSAWPACRCGSATSSRRSPARPSVASTPPSSATLAFEAIDDVTDEALVPEAYRRRVGAAMVADAWRRAVADAQDGAVHG